MSSLDALEDVVRREYDAQERFADALDTKAGLVLGFAGLLVSLTPDTAGPSFALVARLLAGAAGVLALHAFALNPRLGTDLGDISTGTVTVTRYSIVASMVLTHAEIRAATSRKSRRIRAALQLLALALGTIVVGTTVRVVTDLVR